MAHRRDRAIILVVDDYAENREMYSEYLEFNGYRALQAGDGEEAVEIATSEVPDAILMDLALPRVDGWEASRRIRSDDRTCGIPIIALTGHALGVHAQRARDAGCNLVLTKPCLPEDMLAALEKLLQAPSEQAKARTTRTGTSRAR